MNSRKYDLLWSLWVKQSQGGDSEWRKVLTPEEQNQVALWDQAYATEEEDAHDCREHDNGYGICSWCGAIIPGTLADYDLHGYDPPESRF